MTIFRDAELPSELPKGDDAPRPRWELPDLFDFDYYVESDEHAKSQTLAGRQSLAKRDRGLYLERIKARIKQPEHSPAHRRQALRLWLAERRRAEDRNLVPLLPGASFERSQRVVTMILVVLGLIVGATLASALLQYDGTHPVNVSWFVFVMVVVQLGLVGFTLSAWFLRRSKSIQQALRDVSLLAQLIRPLFAQVAHWIQRHRLGHLPPEVRERAKSRQGLLQAHFSLYGPASYLPMLVPVQAFGIAFNIGAIVMTLLLEWFTDLAFGWGSALNIDPAVIYHLARFIATPWSWLFGEGVGYPSLAEVAGTRIHLKDPLHLLDAQHLRAWRWFLVFAVIAYGLIPRLALLGLSVFVQRRALDALPFTHQRTQALYTRLVTPDLDTGLGRTGDGPEMPIPGPLKPISGARAAPRADAAPPGSDKPQDQDAKPPAPQHPKRKSAPSPMDAGSGATVPAPAAGRTQIAADSCVLLLHVDVADVLAEDDHGRLQQLLRHCSGWRVGASATFGGGTAMADRAIALLEDCVWDAPPARVALVDDGSQPPITERLSFLRRVRATVGDSAQILVSLIGDPEGEDTLPAVSDFDLADWQSKIEQLADPYLRLAMLAPRPEEGDDGADAAASAPSGRQPSHAEDD